MCVCLCASVFWYIWTITIIGDNRSQVQLPHYVKRVEKPFFKHYNYSYDTSYNLIQV